MKTLWLCVLSLFPAVSVAVGVHHDLEVKLDPADTTISVTDTIKLTDVANTKFTFELHQALEVTFNGNNVESMQRIPHSSDADSLGGHGTAVFRRYEITLKDSRKAFQLSYSGSITPFVTADNDVIETTGVINDDGIFLARSSRWYPVFSDSELITFDLSVRLPYGWSSVSQGSGAIASKNIQGVMLSYIWHEETPQEEIYLIAAKFKLFSQLNGKVKAQVFLRDDDAALAQKYLDTTGQYIEMYSRLLGEYPYSKFAMVENFWETGYGMPSFTLLGSKVLRFPFILYSSYPHEILHNWWGNGVYVDYDSGNWAEGLTSYLADHLLKEQRGLARSHRRGILQKYRDYVNVGEDFPLSEFRSRHSARSAAIGYGKTAMLFHMLRIELGDKVFIKSLRQLYKDRRYKVTRFSDIQAIFSEQSDRDLKPFFYQWIQRKGAPELALQSASTYPTSKGYDISMTLAQSQHGPPFSLYVPVSIRFPDTDIALKTAVYLSDKEQTFTLPLSAKPSRIDVDPGFDIFRRLDVAEIPSALSQGYGAENPLLILPSRASKEMILAYREMAGRWKDDRIKQMDIILDDDIEQLPANRTIWLLGWENRFIDIFSKIKNEQIKKVTQKSVIVSGQTFKQSQHSIVITARHPQNDQYGILWVASNNLAAIPGLTRKLPHYGKYSYLAFEGNDPTNMAKGQWQLTSSPLAAMLGKKENTPAKWAPRTPLITLPPVISKQSSSK